MLTLRIMVIGGSSAGGCREGVGVARAPRRAPAEHEQAERLPVPNVPTVAAPCPFALPSGYAAVSVDPSAPCAILAGYLWPPTLSVGLVAACAGWRTTAGRVMTRLGIDTRPRSVQYPGCRGTRPPQEVRTVNPFLVSTDEDAECADSPSRRHESDRARWGDDICVWCLEDPTLPHVTGCVCGCQPDAPQHDDELPIDGTLAATSNGRMPPHA